MVADSKMERKTANSLLQITCINFQACWCWLSSTARVNKPVWLCFSDRHHPAACNWQCSCSWLVKGLSVCLCCLVSVLSNNMKLLGQSILIRGPLTVTYPSFHGDFPYLEHCRSLSQGSIVLVRQHRNINTFSLQLSKEILVEDMEAFSFLFSFSFSINWLPRVVWVDECHTGMKIYLKKNTLGI